MMTAESIMDLFEKQVSDNQPISPAKWIEGATRVNMLAGELDNKLAHLESEMNSIEAVYIKQDMPANKAKILARSEVDYKEYLRLKSVLNRIKEFLSLARRRASINEL